MKPVIAGFRKCKPGWVQAPTKSEPIVNLKTAKALGLAVPPPLISRADKESNRL